MSIAIYAALLAALALSQTLRPAAARLAPPAAAVVLAAGALLAGAVWVVGLGLLTMATVGRIGPVAAVGHWSARVLSRHDQVPPAAGLAGLFLLLTVTGILGIAGWRLGAELTRIRRLRALVVGRGAGDLAVIEADAPEALALPGWRGSILVTSAMVRALDAEERRVLLAHERCHLRQAHWAYRLATRLGAALLPTSRPLIWQCDQALERWADESAADHVGDRRLVAAAVAKAALSGAAHDRSLLVAGFAEGAVAERVEALLSDRRSSRWAPLLLPGSLLLVALISLLQAGRMTEDLFELAKQLWVR